MEMNNDGHKRAQGLSWFWPALAFDLADPVLLQVLFKLNAVIIDFTE